MAMYIYIYIYIYIRRPLLVRGHQAARDMLQTDSHKSLKSFNHQLTWRELWVVDMGVVLKTHFIEQDPDRAFFGYLPKMATTSQGSIGALLFASFCERINSYANQVLTSGNSSLGPALIDKIVVLRMNKKFMKFMR